MEEQEAISRIKQGDLDGLEELVNRFQVKAVYSAYLILQDRVLAEEVAHNAFLKAVEKIQSFDETRAFGPWFFRIIINDSIQLLRERKRYEPILEEPEEECLSLAKWLVDSRPSPEQEIENKQTHETFRKALNCLTPEQRKAVVLRYYLQMSEREMSETLVMPVNTIKWWLRSARNRLRLMLKVDDQ